jgi:hypothetical protein
MADKKGKLANFSLLFISQCKVSSLYDIQVFVSCFAVIKAKIARAELAKESRKKLLRGKCKEEEKIFTTE